MPIRENKTIKVKTEDKFKRIRRGESGIMIQLEKGNNRVSVPDDVMPGDRILATHPTENEGIHCEVASASLTTVGRFVEFVDSIYPENTVGSTKELIHSLEEATGFSVDEDSVVSAVIIEGR